VAAFSADKFVIAYESRPANYYNACVIGEVSGTDITYGPKYMFSQNFTSYISPAVLSTDKFVLAYVDGDNFNYGTCIVGDVSGTTITYGSEYVLGPYSTTTIYSSALTENRFVVTYLGTDFGGTSIIGEISGNTITYGSKCVFNLGYPLLAVRFVANLCPTEFLVGYFYTEEDGFTINNTAIIGTATSGWLTGIAKESKTTGQTVPVIIGGVSDVHSGLTSGDVYYATSLGDLTTGSTNYKVGLAISPSEILLGSNRENRDQFFGDMVFANNFRITEGSAFEGLILQNQFGRDILFVDEEGILNIKGLSFNNPATNESGWIMFEDKQGLHLENTKTGKVYGFVLQEAENENNLNGLTNLEKAMKDLQIKNNALKQRLEAVEKTIQKNRISFAR
jgi:hypothetical protein